MPRNRQIDAKVTITFTQNVSIIVRDGDDEVVEGRRTKRLHHK